MELMKPLVTLAFAQPKYLLIYDDGVYKVDELSEEMLAQLLDDTVRIVDLDRCEQMVLEGEEVVMAEIEEAP